VFNLKNGTFYLDRDEFSKPSMDDYCSKVSGTTYDPEAKAPRWEQFLHDIMGGNQEKIDYLQRVAGYCMTGSVKEQVIFFFIGTGRNGKSTFLEIIRHILGSYSKVGAPDLLTTNRVGESKHPAGIADMVGARLVVCSEADKGSYLSEATVKMITGEEALKARHMGKDWFTFQATQKIVVLANHKPIVRGTDNGIWRRIHVVPFDVVISEAKQDRDLLLKLKREAAGIFNWMLEGFRKYRDIGLKPPEEVQAAVKDYRESMDILADFLNEECVLEKRSEVPLSELYNAYTMFCAGRGDKAISNKAFSSSLVERGYRKDRNARGTIFHGIDLKSR
jgi:putative DNA primase/helicase